ncbi:protein crumbs homolog 1-like [Sardina pilchardus]|uniref:protein crumbs homolog 1-like n=1 Tax=Sardina pilchardus TaxID=27697 RepID=UPI002E157608
MWKVFLWTVVLLQTGAVCQELINGCALEPCQNGGLCETGEGIYTCHCSQESLNGQLYGGVNCTVPLVGCRGHRCQNGGSCSPYLSNGRHRYTCACPKGFTGPKCRTPTTFSFENDGYLHIQPSFTSADGSLNITLSFRTDQTAGTLLQRKVEDLLLTVELVDGQVRHTMRQAQGPAEVLQEVLVEGMVADGRWHQLEASLRGGTLGLTLQCADDDCPGTESSGQSPAGSPPSSELGSGYPEPGAVPQSLFVGGVRGDGAPHFIGCIQDFHVESRLVVPGVGLAAKAEQVNVTAGCSERDRCEDGPCQNRGRCISQGWMRYSCECHRPYEGDHCQEEYVTARFGNEDAESYASFLVEDEPSETVALSLFIRTRRPQGLLLVLANSTSQYLRVWLDEGRVKVQINNFETLASHGMVNDGQFHLVSVKIEQARVALFLSARSQGNIPIRNILLQTGDRLYVGGLPDRRASLAFGGYFKGCVQDLRMSSKHLQFYPIGTAVSSYVQESLVKVTRGCASDNSCSANPCLNGGVCYSIWDDFACNCPPNTAGQRCEKVKWCELSPCPSSATCLPDADGFQCVSNVTFRENSTILTYRGNGKIQRPLASVSLQFRTRASEGILLHAERGNEFISVSIQSSHLLLELQGDQGASRLSIESERPVSDGEWHMAELVMQEPMSLTSKWALVLDGDMEEAAVSKDACGNLDFLKDGVDILVGGLGAGAGGNLVGCLGPLEIGGLLLPVYTDSEANLPRPQEEQFLRTSSSPWLGCWGADVCGPDPCHNGGVCTDLFNKFRCECPLGLGGPHCDETVDACDSKPCVHGNCTSKPMGFECKCESGFEGRLCEAHVDACASNECGQGATCLRGIMRYACLCPRNATGALCRDKIPETPWYIERVPYPKLPVSICGNENLNFSCFNGGNCSTIADTCDCMPGFTGQWCEQDVDECASDPCLNGGYCRNLINRFQCVCEMSYSGEHCQIDVSDFYAYVFLLLWQNIFQLLSYLIIRLDDDDPEIDWGGNDW